MDDVTEPAAEQPSNADLLAAIQSFAAQTAHRFDRLDAGQAQLRADVAAVKVDTAYTEAHIGDLHEAVRRHIGNPNAHGQEAA